MDAFVQRMIQRFQEQIFQRMPRERKARKLAVMKALAKSVKIKDKENEDPLNNNMALPYNFTHSTPVKNPGITDLDKIESETELTESEVCGEEEDWNKTEVCSSILHTTYSIQNQLDEPKLVISKIYDLRDGQESGDSKVSVEIPGEESAETEVTISVLEDKSKHWRSLEVLHETAEYEFCRSLEQSKLFVSTSSLLEEIEAHLPSPYSLAKPLNHTFHTLSSYRTQTRLARMDSNLTCLEIMQQGGSPEVGIPSKKIEHLEVEATVQKALAEQAEKALILSKMNKFYGVEHLECEKALLLANLRRSAAIQEAKKLRMLGEVSEKENFGKITIKDIYFEVNVSRDECPGKYICTVTERERVQSTFVVDEVPDGKIHFKEPLKFENLSKEFVLYIDLFKLLFKEPKKALLTSTLVRKLKKMTAPNLNRSLTSSAYSCCGFVCIFQCELRLQNIINRLDEKCVLQNYLTGNQQHPAVGSTVGLIATTDIQIKSTLCGFLNAFQQTWNRRWFSQSGCFLESWLYPEDKESDKPPLDTIYLPNCSSVETVGLEVCIRPYSFVITLKDNNGEILFSANSHKDMLTWVDHLNVMIQQIRLWKPNA